MTNKNAYPEFPVIAGREVIDSGFSCPRCAAAAKRNVGGRTPTLRMLTDGSDERFFCVSLHGFISDTEIVLAAIRAQGSPPADMSDSRIWHAEDELRREDKIYRDENGEWIAR